MFQTLSHVSDAAWRCTSRTQTARIFPTGPLFTSPRRLPLSQCNQASSPAIHTTTTCSYCSSAPPAALGRDTSSLATLIHCTRRTRGGHDAFGEAIRSRLSPPPPPAQQSSSFVARTFPSKPALQWRRCWRRCRSIFHGCLSLQRPSRAISTTCRPCCCRRP